MKKNKINNLFVCSKKVALIALMTMSLTPKAKAYSEIKYKSPIKQHEYYNHGVMHNGTHKNNKELLEIFLLPVGFGLVCMGLGYAMGTLSQNKRDQYTNQR